MKTLRELIESTDTQIEYPNLPILDETWCLLTKPDLTVCMYNLHHYMQLSMAEDGTSLITGTNDVYIPNNELVVHVSRNGAPPISMVALHNLYRLVPHDFLLADITKVYRARVYGRKVIYTVTPNDEYETCYKLDTILVGQRILHPESVPDLVTITIHKTPRAAKEFLAGRPKVSVSNSAEYYGLLVTVPERRLLEISWSELLTSNPKVLRVYRRDLVELMEDIEYPKELLAQAHELKYRLEVKQVTNFTFRIIEELRAFFKVLDSIKQQEI